MEALLILLVLVGLVAAGTGVAFYVRFWTTLGQHRQTMHALYLYLADQRAFPPPPGPPGHIPPQGGRR